MRPDTESLKDFSYETALYSVSPNVGSKAGGTIITLKGKNFSPVKQ